MRSLFLWPSICLALHFIWAPPVRAADPPAGSPRRTNHVLGRAFISVATSSAPRVEVRDALTWEHIDNIDLASVPGGVAIGPNDNVYVWHQNSGPCLEFDGTTYQLVRTFIESGAGGSLQGREVGFTPDGDFVVAGGSASRIARFDGTTGAYLGNLVSPGAGGLSTCFGFAFDPSGRLYVGSMPDHRILRYDGQTGVFLDEFVSDTVGEPYDLMFGPDGHLYVATYSEGMVRRYDQATGQLIDVFTSEARPRSRGIAFGPDGGFFVCSFGVGYTSGFFRYDGITGDFLNHEIGIPAMFVVFDGSFAGPIRNDRNGHVYQRLTTPCTIIDAVPISGTLQIAGATGYVATVTSASEEEFVRRHLGGDMIRNHWLGAQQIPGSSEPDGGWSWLTNEPWDYANWAPGQPDNSNGNDSHVVISGDVSSPLGTWDDQTPFHAGGGFIVEYKPCRPDLSDDGIVNSQDFVLFLGYFVLGDPLADFNGDGRVDSRDFSAFLNAFVLGC
jgi:streptogramin lyase